MYNFQEAMERLVLDPGFAHALAANPTLALEAYALDDDERRALLTQVSPDAAEPASVEQRTSKAGMFAFLGDIADVIGAAHPEGSGVPDGETHGMIIHDSSTADTHGMIIHDSSTADTQGIIIHDSSTADTHGIIINDMSEGETDGIIIHYAEAEHAPDEAEVKTAQPKAPIDELVDMKHHPSDDMLRSTAEPDFPVR